jgi:hypothetical protein
MTWFIIYLIALAIVLPSSLILVSVNRTDDYDLLSSHGQKL